MCHGHVGRSGKLTCKQHFGHVAGENRFVGEDLMTVVEERLLKYGESYGCRDGEEKTKMFGL